MATSLLTQYSAFSNTTVTVTNQAQLNAAINSLGTGGGGTILLSGSGGPYQISANGIGGANNAIHIQSADVNNPAHVTNVNVLNSSYVTMSDFYFSSGNHATPGGDQYDFRVNHSDHVQIENLYMNGGATQNLGLNDAATTAGAQGIDLTSVSNVLINNITMDGYLDGIEMIGVSDVKILNSEFMNMQADGIRGGGWQHVTISDNYFHDWHGVAYELVHADMIQMWSWWPHNVQNMDIQINGNILDAGNGAATQSMLLDSNAFNTAGHPNEGVYTKDIRVFDNTIYNGHFHGVTITHADGAQVYNNTIIWNSDAAASDVSGKTPISTPPTIRLSNVLNATVQDNIAWKVEVNGSLDSSDNYFLEYNNTSASNYVGFHFVNATSGSNASLTDLQLKTTSTLYGSMGSNYTSGGGFNFQTLNATTPSTTASSGSGQVTDTASPDDTQSPGSTDSDTNGGTGNTDTDTDTEASGGGTTSPSEAGENSGSDSEAAEDTDTPTGSGGETVSEDDAEAETPGETPANDNEEPGTGETGSDSEQDPVYGDADTPEDDAPAASDEGEAEAPQAGGGAGEDTEVPNAGPEDSETPVYGVDDPAEAGGENVTSGDGGSSPEDAEPANTDSAPGESSGEETVTANASGGRSKKTGESDGGSDFFLVKLLQALLGGSDDSEEDSANEEPERSFGGKQKSLLRKSYKFADETMLSDIVPVIAEAEEAEASADDEDDEDEDFYKIAI